MRLARSRARFRCVVRGLGWGLCNNEGQEEKTSAGRGHGASRVGCRGWGLSSTNQRDARCYIFNRYVSAARPSEWAPLASDSTRRDLASRFVYFGWSRRDQGCQGGQGGQRFCDHPLGNLQETV